MISSPRWTEEVNTRWQRLCAWPALEIADRFLEQLKEATGWSTRQCWIGIEEYRRFALLASLRGGAVTPSAAVDQVWHLHLTYTQDYWLDFCPQRLGFSFHHAPSLGRPGEAGHLAQQYREMLADYTALFGPPPPAWWPETAFPAARSQRVQRRLQKGMQAWRTRLREALEHLPWHAQAWTTTRLQTHPQTRPWPTWLTVLFAACGLALPSLSLALPANPLNWDGPDFLRLYLVLLVLAGFASWLLRLSAANQGSLIKVTPPTVPDLWMLAMLVGGPLRLRDVALTRLFEMGCLRWDAQAKRLQLHKPLDSDDPILQQAAHAADKSETPWLKPFLTSAAVHRLQSQMENFGWLHPEYAHRQLAWRCALPFTALAVFGLIKIIIGILRERPVGMLVFLSMLAFILAICCYRLAPFRTTLGSTALRRAKAAYSRPTAISFSTSTTLSPQTYAVAIGGSAALSDTAYAAYFNDRKSSAGGDSSSGCSGDGGGGGCGGCGGGGD